MISAPALINPSHNFSQFSCGEPSLDTWLHDRALKNEDSGASRSYVVCSENEIIAYYSLAFGSIEHRYTPSNIKRNMPDPIPVMILARLAVDLRYAGQNIGTAMLGDALLRTVQASKIAGIRALLVHALNEKAALFYKNRGFITSPFDSKILFLQIRYIVKRVE